MRDRDDIERLIDDIFDAANDNDDDDDEEWVNMPIEVGSWGTNPKTAWEERLDYTSDYVIKKTGMTRNELKKLLQYLDDHNIIR